MNDGLRDELADVYARWAEAPFEPADWQRQNGYQLADELLPVVRRYVASVLRRANREDGTTVAKLSPVERLTCRLVKSEDLVTRADAIEAGE